LTRGVSAPSWRTKVRRDSAGIRKPGPPAHSSRRLHPRARQCPGWDRRGQRNDQLNPCLETGAALPLGVADPLEISRRRVTDPASRSMATSGRGSCVVGYNVQVAVDMEHHLIVTHEVTNSGSDRAELANVARKQFCRRMSSKPSPIAGTSTVPAITVTLPKPFTSGAKAGGRFRQAGLRLSSGGTSQRCLFERYRPFFPPGRFGPPCRGRARTQMSAPQAWTSPPLVFSSRDCSSGNHAPPQVSARPGARIHSWLLGLQVAKPRSSVFTIAA
jgi:hypothetical protein